MEKIRIASRKHEKRGQPLDRRKKKTQNEQSEKSMQAGDWNETNKRKKQQEQMQHNMIKMNEPHLIG